MADRRIGIPKDKLNFIDRMTKTSENPDGAFKTRADVLAFCAAYGYKHGKRKVLKECADNPIRYDVFQNQGHDIIFDVLALAETNEASILENSDERLDDRSTIFEEYANGGLEILETQLKGLADVLETLLLIMQEEIASLNRNKSMVMPINGDWVT